MNDLYLIIKIIEYDSTLLYYFLCVNSDLNKNILNNITILHLLNIPNTTMNYEIDPLSSTKCVIYKCIQPCVFFDINKCESLMHTANNVKDICELYYNEYNEIHLC